MDIATAFTALNGAFSLWQTAAAARDDAKIANAKQEVTRVLIEAQAACLDLQQKLFASSEAERAAKDEARQLREKIGELLRKAEERERYELAKLYINTYVYRLREDAQDGQPMHYLCQPCMDNSGKKSVLQGGETALRCPECNQTYRIAEQPPLRVF